MVPDSARDTRRVIATPSTMTPVSISAETADCARPAAAAPKNMAMMAMRVGEAAVAGYEVVGEYGDQPLTGNR